VHPPSVDALARSLADVELPPPLLVDAAREAIAAGDPDSARARAADIQRALLRPVVNATGVLLHTNLGRAPLAVHQDAGYTNLELDLLSGRRGSRHAHVGRLLARLCGAEAAIVVNNNAAAVLLVLAALAAGRQVLVSRGESVEIGGGFRVPEIMAQSGAWLVDVGTTNRTRLGDYERALGPEVGLVLKVHPSNFRLEGFTATVPVAELARLGPPVVYDLGSGLLDAACPWLTSGPPAWLREEPAARQSLAAGATAVTFSGDKLLGGPQAGIIAGAADVVAACAAHPLARALRPGGLVLGALQDVVLAYLRREGDTIPFWRLATLPVDGLEARAGRLGAGTVVACDSLPGAGSLPGIAIPSAGVAVDGDHTAALRAADPPVIARVAGGRTVCDLRAVDPADDAHLGAALRVCAPWPS
jgi:L-seryl-tRNA(Ser) seleniumtransferase